MQADLLPRDVPLDLALALAVTIRHDGQGGVADDLAEPQGLTRWVRERADAPGSGGAASGARGRGGPDGPGELHEVHDLRAFHDFRADAASLAAVVEVRTAIRALFARAVLPGEPSSADAGRLPDAGAALERLNAAAALVPVVPRLDWPQDGPPAARYAVPGGPGPADRLAAALARAAIAFLAGPDRARLKACPAPRCVRYFVKQHARQEWCKPSCGNRARVARHHARRRPQPPTDPA